MKCECKNNQSVLNIIIISNTIFAFVGIESLHGWVAERPAWILSKPKAFPQQTGFTSCLQSLRRQMDTPVSASPSCSVCPSSNLFWSENGCTIARGLPIAASLPISDRNWLVSKCSSHPRERERNLCPHSWEHWWSPWDLPQACVSNLAHWACLSPEGSVKTQGSVRSLTVLLATTFSLCPSHAQIILLFTFFWVLAFPLWFLSSPSPESSVLERRWPGERTINLQQCVWLGFRGLL